MTPSLRLMRFIAWFGIVYGALGVLTFCVRCLTNFSSILILVRLRGAFAQASYLSDLALEASSLLLLVGCIEWVKGKTNARTLSLIWALCALVIGFGCELAIFGRVFPSLKIANDWLWLAGRIAERTIRSGFALTLLCIVSMPQALEALTKRRAFEVVTGSQVPPDAMSVEQPEPNDDQATFSYQLMKRLAMVGIVLGLAGTIALLIGLWGRYFGIFDHGLPNNWRGGVISAIERASKMSFVLLLLGGVLMFLEKSPGRWILMVWAFGFVGLSLGTFLFYDLPFMWWNATQSITPARYLPFDMLLQLSRFLEVPAFAIIAAQALLVYRVALKSRWE